ncbi:MAG: polyamine aminopropyltransferase [candidate division WOR-3 bacterium]
MKEFREYHKKNAGIFLKIDKILFNKNSKFQKILLFENKDFGKVLALDNFLMLTEKDEYFYHEAIVHPALSLIKNPEKVLIIGGGDGKTVYEVLKHGVKEINLVEIDEEVIKISEKNFKWGKVFKNKKVKIFVQDAYEFVKRINEKYDLIIGDFPDPVGPAKKLYEKEFYLNIKKILKKKGILVIQAESPIYHKGIQRKIYNEIKEIFKICKFYFSPAPTYPGGVWLYLFASDFYNPLKSKIKREIKNLKFYSKKIHKAIFEIGEILYEVPRI